MEPLSLHRVALFSFAFFFGFVATRCDGKKPIFDRSLVRAGVTSKPQFGGQIEVYFVQEGSDAELFALARDCVHEFSREYKSAACFAFRSDADFEYAKVDRVNGGMQHLCWRARYFRPLGGGESGEEGNEGNDLSYNADACPGGP